MIWRTAASYEYRTSPIQWNSLTANLAAQGVSLINSFHSAVCLIAPDGAQELASVSDIEAFVRDETTFSMQFWFDDSTDVGFSMRFAREFRVIEFDLDGLDHEQRIVVCKTFNERVQRMMQLDNSKGAFVDCDGATENMDWDLFFQGNCAFAGPSPDYVVVQHELNSLPADVPEGYAQLEIGRYQLRRRLRSPYSCPA